jgi:hypothetical protein
MLYLEKGLKYPFYPRNLKQQHKPPHSQIMGFLRVDKKEEDFQEAVHGCKI